MAGRGWGGEDVRSFGIEWGLWAVAGKGLGLGRSLEADCGAGRAGGTILSAFWASLPLNCPSRKGRPV